MNGKIFLCETEQNTARPVGIGIWDLGVGVGGVASKGGLFDGCGLVARSPVSSGCWCLAVASLTWSMSIVKR
jgi:hypothetical protein